MSGGSEMLMGGILPGMMSGGKGGGGGSSWLEGLFTGGDGGTSTPPPAVPPAAPGGGAPPTRQLPGYSGPEGNIQLFGRLSPEQLAAYNQANNIVLPKPPGRQQPAPKAPGLFKQPTYDDGRGP